MSRKKRKTPKARAQKTVTAKRTADRPSTHGVFERRPLAAARKTKRSTVKKSRGLHLGMHLLIAGSAVAVLVLLGVVERNTFATRISDAADDVPATIGLEHTSPLSLSILFARKEHAGYVSIANGSSETIHVNLPSTWTRTEVTGAPLSEVKQEIPVFGFVRWTLPGKAGMKLILPKAPGAVFFDSVSPATAAIDLKTIDLVTLNVSNRMVLVQKQTLVPLWTQEE